MDVTVSGVVNTPPDELFAKLAGKHAGFLSGGGGARAVALAGRRAAVQGAGMRCRNAIHSTTSTAANETKSTGTITAA